MVSPASERWGGKSDEKKKRTTKADGVIEDVDKGVRTGARRGEREHAGPGWAGLGWARKDWAVLCCAVLRWSCAKKIWYSAVKLKNRFRIHRISIKTLDGQKPTILRGGLAIYRELH